MHGLRVSHCLTASLPCEALCVTSAQGSPTVHPHVASAIYLPARVPSSGTDFLSFSSPGARDAGHTHTQKGNLVMCKMPTKVLRCHRQRVCTAACSITVCTCAGTVCICSTASYRINMRPNRSGYYPCALRPTPLRSKLGRAAFTEMFPLYSTRPGPTSWTSLSALLSVPGMLQHTPARHPPRPPRY